MFCVKTVWKLGAMTVRQKDIKIYRCINSYYLAAFFVSCLTVKTIVAFVALS